MEGVFPHQARHTMLIARLARLPEIEVYPRRPVYALVRGERCLNQSQQARVLYSPHHRRALKPLVGPAGYNAHLLVHDCHREPRPVGLDDLILLPNLRYCGIRWPGRYI
jgi:hypothetical protein